MPRRPSAPRFSPPPKHIRAEFAVLFRMAVKMARPKRFELLTPRFVVWCSIQLSYGRVFRETSWAKRPDASELIGNVAKERFSYPLRPGLASAGTRVLTGDLAGANRPDRTIKRSKTRDLRPRALVADALQFH